MAADLQLYSEIAMPPGETVRIPPLRRLTNLVTTANNWSEVFHRPTPHGQSIGLSSCSDRIYFKHVSSLAVMEALLEAEQWRLSQSDNGLFAAQLAERLGGRGSEMPNEAAVRSVLYAAAAAERASPFDVFRQKARQVQGNFWPKRFFFSQPELYAQHVVYRLLRAKLLHPAMRVRCPYCANDSDASPEDLTTEMTCHLCDKSFPLGFAMAVKRGTAWSCRLSSTIQPGRLAESLALLASLSVVQSLGNGPNSTHMHVLGLKFESKSHKCEVDLVAAINRGRSLMPELVIGEVKSRFDGISADDIENLEIVQRSIQSAGLPCTVLCASLRPSLDDVERADLRRLCERVAASATGGQWSGSGMPLVLTANDLSASWLDPPHPARWEPAGASLSTICYESCRRNLGLNSVAPNVGLGGWELSWSD